MTFYKTAFTAFVVLFFTSCETNFEVKTDGSSSKGTHELPILSYDAAALFPGDGSLNRCEDGVSLPDGSIVVSDQLSGLRMVAPDGTSKPFGKFAEAGITFHTEANTAAPNGVDITPDGKYILMADVIVGRLYRVEIETETAEMLYQHPFGINTMHMDSKGVIWFSQSSNNLPEEGFGGVFKDAVTPAPNGAVYRLEESDGSYKAVKVVEGIYFANGITMDPDEQYLYLSETLMDRVLRWPMADDGKSLGEREIFCTVTTPDNISFDAMGRLWVASPFSNQVHVFRQDGRANLTIFSADSDNHARMSAMATEYRILGKPIGELLTPELSDPMPGLLTGMFLSQDGKTLYISNLGNDLLRYSLVGEQ